MTVRTAAWTDAGAPQITGEIGTLNDALHAILVTGYGTTQPAGWTREFNDAASRTMVWRPAAGPRHYLQVQDNGPGAGTYKEARIRGYETMSAYNTGTGPFPTTGQAASGRIIRKSAALSATQCPWHAVYDESTLYLLIDSLDSTARNNLYFFGAFNSWKPNDTYASLISGRNTENSSLQSYGYNHASGYTTVTGTEANAYCPRTFTGVGTAITLQTKINYALGNNSTGGINYGYSGDPYPHAIDGSLILSPIYLCEGSKPRGTLRGLWNPGHIKPLLQGDTFTLADGAINRTLTAYDINNGGQILIETSQTWDA